MNIHKVRNELNLGIPITNIKLRVTDYARVSTENIKQKKSLQNQVEHFDEYIKKNSNWSYVKGYVDDGITGTSDTKREQFMKMIEDAKSEKFDLIITKEISRFSRNTLDSIKYTRELLECGVAVFFVNDNINTALPDSELRLTIMASMAQDEIRRLSERVKFGMNRAIEKGEILGNDLLYGYKKNKDTGCLEIIENEAELVKRLYNLYLFDNLSLSAIAKIFNNENIRTKQGKQWGSSTLSRMIANPKYKGYYCGNKTKTDNFITKKIKCLNKEEWKLYKDNNKIPPIIEEELWEMANTRLNLRKEAYFKRKNNKEIYINRYLYSAKIICNEHNVVFHRRKFRKNSTDFSWACSEYLKNGKSKCNSPNIRESELNVIFNNIINILLNDKNEVINILLNLYKKYNCVSGFGERIRKLEEERLMLIIKKDKLLELNIENNISNSEFYIRNNQMNNEINKIDKEIIELEKQKKELNIENDEFQKLKKILKLNIESRFINEKIITLLLDKIIVEKINNCKNDINLKIFLNFKKKYQFRNQDYDIFNLKNSCIKNNYNFKRGYDTTGTKRYIMKYMVNCYIDM